MMKRYSGLQELVFIKLCLQRTPGLMMIFLHQEKSICAGAINKGYTIKYNYKSTVIMWAELPTTG
jgi:hypothetical protein